MNYVTVCCVPNWFDEISTRGSVFLVQLLRSDESLFHHEVGSEVLELKAEVAELRKKVVESRVEVMESKVE